MRMDVFAFTKILLTVAIIDTGLDLNDPRFKDHLCPTGHRDFTGQGIQDTEGHGTHVTGLIRTYAKDADYCMYIIKYYPPKNKEAGLDEEIKYASSLKPNIINLSSVGFGFNLNEKLAIENSQATLVVSAGNDSMNLDWACLFYPACYKLYNTIVVGALDKNKHLAIYSNYGSVVTAWELGNDIVSDWPNGKKATLSGTSMATAIFTGKLLFNSK